MSVTETICNAVSMARVIAEDYRATDSNPCIRIFLDSLRGYLEATESEFAKDGCAKQFWGLYSPPIEPYHLQGFAAARVVLELVTAWMEPDPPVGVFLDGKLHTALPEIDWQQLIVCIKDEAALADRAAGKPENTPPKQPTPRYKVPAGTKCPKCNKSGNVEVQKTVDLAANKRRFVCKKDDNHDGCGHSWPNWKLKK